MLQRKKSPFPRNSKIINFLLVWSISIWKVYKFPNIKILKLSSAKKIIEIGLFLTSINPNLMFTNFGLLFYIIITILIDRKKNHPLLIIVYGIKFLSCYITVCSLPNILCKYNGTIIDIIQNDFSLVVNKSQWKIIIIKKIR